jgi:ferredoxin-thioredoxin reductase catalytic chain
MLNFINFEGQLCKTPADKSLDRIRKFVKAYCEKSGTTAHPIEAVTDGVVLGLAANLDELGRPLCPCRFYSDKREEITHPTWICACNDMQVYKYCHCLLFVNAEGLPITEYLPKGHVGRETYGLVKDPTPDKGRPLRDKAEEREKERRERGS